MVKFQKSSQKGKFRTRSSKYSGLLQELREYFREHPEDDLLEAEFGTSREASIYRRGIQYFLEPEDGLTLFTRGNKLFVARNVQTK